MRIVFVGAVQFSRHCLLEVVRLGGNVVAVVSPERSHATKNSDYADLAPVAEKYHIPLIRVGKVNDPRVVELIRGFRPDIIFVFGFSQLIGREILGIPQLGCVGSHPALLPRNRGRHPLIWALVEELPESGLTFFYMDEGADSGDILWQRAFPITLDDDAGTLHAKIEDLASQALREFLPQLEAGTAQRISQDHTRATYWRKRTENDGEIDWSGPARAAYNLIRALTSPYVGAHTYSCGRRVVIWKSRLCPGVKASEVSGLAGEILRETGGALQVQCGDGLLELLEWDASGATLKPGDKFGADKQ